MKLYPNHLSEKIGFDAIRESAREKAVSTMGREELHRLVPSIKRSKIERQLAQTAEMMELLQNDASFPLQNLHDVREYARSSRAEGTTLPLEAFNEILDEAVTSRRVKSFIADRADIYPQLKEASVGLIPLKDLEKEIKQVVTDAGGLRNDASRDLKRIRTRLNKKRNDLRTTINRVMGRASKEGMTSDEGPTLRGGRMVIPIQAEYKRKIQGFVHDVSSSGQTVFLEPVEALNINNEIRQLESEEKQEIERILRALTNHVRKQRESIIQNCETLGLFDAIAAKARLSIQLNGFVPVLSENSHLYLKEAYNPILLLKNSRLKEKKREPVIPLDIELDKEERCLVITGPNAGGKSVAMKTLGLCVMMMQAGFPIPARDSSELPVYSGLFIDMGDDQSIENDLSTFSSRLEWMKQTLEHANKHSLVLIDEAAAGTDPEEGGALFQAFIEQLMDRKAKVIVTTHHGSLKVFAHEHPKAVNGSMEFDQSNLSPTYRFKKGIPGSSYAFEIAERMNLNDHLLSEARKLLGEAKSSMENLISELESKTQEANQLKEKYDKLKAKTEAERHRYEEKRSGIEKDKEAIREKALKEAQHIMDSANQRIEEAVEKVVQQGQKDKASIKQARKEVEEHKKQVGKELEKLEAKKEKRSKKKQERPGVGDIVRLQDGKTTGELEEVNGKQAVVMAGGLRLKTKYQNLVKVKDAAEVQKPKQKVKVNVERKFVKPSLEIRGMRGEEAMKEVQYYLDNAIAAGRNEVDIIHGKGEGILKKLVHEYLDKRKEVKSYDMAPLSRGGAGCTIVKL
ncbi:MAG: endonuclease MutS2 [Balneolaceae bacterium]|nr:endonuclease MutS2 [Balneolaceae bacterium]